MKPLPLIVCLCGIAVLAETPRENNTIPPLPSGGTPGRFQLVSATILIDNDPSSSPIPMVFRIDTATGRVWKYDNITFPVHILGSDVKTIETDGWSITAESLTESIKESTDLKNSLLHAKPKDLP